MKRFVRSIMFTGALALGASGLMAAQPNNTGMEQWFKAKYGRPSPMEEERLKAELANAAFREEPSEPTAAVNWTEQYFKAKSGRNTPAEETRLKAERDSTAYREGPAGQVGPGRTWTEELHLAKYGRLPGK